MPPTQFQFSIPLEESRQFATLSGDHNPIHVDPIYARRSAFGGAITHGVHCVLKALDGWAAGRSQGFALKSLRADFHGAAPAGSIVYVRSTETGDKLSLTLRGPYGPVQHLRLRFQELADPCPALPASGEPGGVEPTPRKFADAEGLTGVVPFAWEPALAETLFASLFRLMPHAQVAGLLATTRIVGMECPGLHSLFTGLDLELDHAEANDLRYRVVDLDDRFQMVTIAVEAPAIRGGVKALFRPEPLAQESFASLRARCTPGQFSSQRALVVGGSRGLGELAAKLIAAGGGDVYLTYARGADDAAKLVSEIQAHGGAANAGHLDVTDLPESAPPGLDAPTHVYYFATPHIVLNRSGAWDCGLHTRFESFYVAGLDRLIRLLRSWYPGAEFTLYYPSSVFVNEPEPGAAEYAAAKAAGETLCHYLDAAFDDVKIRAKRLPRVRTDQTNAPGLDSSAFPDAAEVLLRWFAED